MAYDVAIVFGIAHCGADDAAQGNHHYCSRQFWGQLFEQEQGCQSTGTKAKGQSIKMVKAGVVKQGAPRAAQTQQVRQLGQKDQNACSLGEAVEDGRCHQVHQPATAQRTQQPLHRTRHDGHPCRQCDPLGTAGLSHADQ